MSIIANIISHILKTSPGVLGDASALSRIGCANAPNLKYAAVLTAGVVKILYLTLAPKPCFGTIWVNEN